MERVQSNQQLIEAAEAVCRCWERKPRDNVQIGAAVKKLKESLSVVDLGNKRQVHSSDPRRNEPI